LSLSMPTRLQKLGTGASLSLSMPTRFQKLGTRVSLSLSMPTQYRQMTEEFFLTTKHLKKQEIEKKIKGDILRH